MLKQQLKPSASAMDNKINLNRFCLFIEYNIKQSDSSYTLWRASVYYFQLKFFLWLVASIFLHLYYTSKISQAWPIQKRKNHNRPIQQITPPKQGRTIDHRINSTDRHLSYYIVIINIFQPISSRRRVSISC